MTREPLSILLIGCGHMGTALALALVAASREVNLTVVEPDAEGARRRLSSVGVVSVVANTDALVCTDYYDVAILAVRPQDAPIALSEASAHLRNVLIVSIVAGVSLDVLSRTAPEGARVVRAMPNLPVIAQRRITVGYAAEQGISANDRRVIEDVFSAAGSFRWLASEDALNVATGISGSGPAYVFAFVEHLQKAAEALGLSSDDASVLARETVIGGARVLEDDPRSAEELKTLVATRGGTTAAGLAELETVTALPQALARATAAATERARQISRENSYAAGIGHTMKPAERTIS